MEPTCFDAYEDHGPGAVHGYETDDLDLTVVAWPEFRGVDPHVNRDVDVACIVISGQGEAIVDGRRFALRLGSVVLIPKGAERSIRSKSVDFRYVNVHRRRKRLMPTMGRPAKP